MRVDFKIFKPDPHLFESNTITTTRLLVLVSHSKNLF